MSRSLHPRLPLAAIAFGLAGFFIFSHSGSPLYLLGAGLCFFLFDSLGVEIGVHKLLCHRSFSTSVFWKRLLAFLAVFSGQGSPLVWVAVHMSSHHPFSDTDEDVHSPRHGMFYAFLAWYWRLDTSKIKFSPIREYVKDPVLRFFHERHLEILLAYWALLLLIGKLSALVYFGLLPAAASICLVGLVNCFMHSAQNTSISIFGKYKNHPESPAYNSVWLGILTMGLGLHNNHHKNPGKCFYDEQWYELDLSRFIIPLLSERPESQRVAPEAR